MGAFLKTKILRAYDIRGVVDEDLFEQDAWNIGKSFGSIVKDHHKIPKIAVGYDGRLSSPPLKKCLIDGLLTTGAQVIEIGLGPSPMLYYANHFLKCNAAIMVTGSHNPPNHNGFKFVFDNKPFFGSQIQDLGYRIIKQDFHKDVGTLEFYDIKGDYLSYLASDFLNHYSKARPLKIAWDAGNGATGDILKLLIKQIPGKHILLNEVIDGHFPAHGPDPTVAKNLIQLQQTVLQEECDLGIAFDGDGDRLGIVDDQGEIIWGDQLLKLYAEEVLTHHPGATIIADVKASQTLFEYINTLGGKGLMWATGHSLIKAKMFETKALLAGEMSGHIFFADRHPGYDDALYAALRLIGILGQRTKKLSVWHQSFFKVFNTPEIRIECSQQDKFGIIASIKSTLERQHQAYFDLDGIRVAVDHGWWLLRASHTQEAIVARFESNSLEHLNKLKEKVEGYLQQFNLTLYEAPI
jgi:phosphomannomutase